MIYVIAMFTFLCMESNLSSFRLLDMKTLHDYTAIDIEGNTFDFGSLKGKKVMIVNTASKCGLTGQYKTLQSLYEKYQDENFVIIGFPSNNFMWQEPGTNAEIDVFCKKNYGVTFPMMSKVTVKGKSKHPIFEYLTNKELNGVLDTKVAWNFQKFLINEEGILERVISPKTKPDDIEILMWIKR